jgi:hypothetical protein
LLSNVAISPRELADCRSSDSGRDFFSTHFDINYLPENQARTEALCETRENGGRAAYDDGRRVTFVARFYCSRGRVFSKGEWLETRTLLCRGNDLPVTVGNHDLSILLFDKQATNISKLAVWIENKYFRRARLDS